jgi:clan AA aspartic protease (TIGR02281 family)
MPVNEVNRIRENRCGSCLTASYNPQGETAMRNLLILCLVFATVTWVDAAEDFLSQGARQLEAGHYQKAVRSFEQAIKVSPDSAQAYKGLGLAYYKLGDHEVAYDVELISYAVNALKKSLALRQDPEVSYFLGLSYLVLYDRENAEFAYASLKTGDSKLAEQLEAKLAAYVKPAKMEHSHGSAPRKDLTAVVIEGNRVLVPVTISHRGRSVKTTLLLDTGASVTAISHQVAAELGVDPKDTNPAAVTVADGRTVVCRWFVADSLEVGSKSIAPLRTAILPGGMAGVEGLLGMDFLRTVRYQVDFNRNVIEWGSR